MIVLPLCILFVCSCKVFLGSTIILCGSSICMVAYELKRGNAVGLILVETFNGLDAF